MHKNLQKAVMSIIPLDAIWDYEHEQIIDEAKEVKVLLSARKWFSRSL